MRTLGIKHTLFCLRAVHTTCELGCSLQVGWKLASVGSALWLRLKSEEELCHLHPGIDSMATSSIPLIREKCL